MIQSVIAHTIASASHLSPFVEVIVAAAGIVVASLAAYAAKVLVDFVRNFSKVLVAVVGKPADKFGPGEPGLVKTVADHGDTFVKQAYAIAEQDKKLDTLLLSARVLVDDSKTNGGKSSRDVIDRIEAIVTSEGGE